MLHNDFNILLNVFAKKNASPAELKSAELTSATIREILLVEPALDLLFNKWKNTPFDMKKSELRSLNSYVKNKFYNILSLYYIFKKSLRIFFEGERYLLKIKGVKVNAKYEVDKLNKTITFSVVNLSDSYELFLDIARIQMKRMLYIVATRNHLKAKIKLHVIKRGHRCLGYCATENPTRIGFKWQMIFIPESVQEVLICHELAHLKHKNHGKLFWAHHEELLGRPVFEADKELVLMNNFTWLCNP